MSESRAGAADVPVFAMGDLPLAVGGEEGPVVGVGEVESALTERGDVQQIAVDQMVAAGANADEVVGVGFASS